MHLGLHFEGLMRSSVIARVDVIGIDVIEGHDSSVI